MEKIGAIKVNRPEPYSNEGFSHKYIYDCLPQPECRNLSYIDSRCLGLLNPSSLLEILPKRISNPQNLVDIVNKNSHLKALLDKNNFKISEGDFINFLEFTDKHMKMTAKIASRLCDEIKKPIDKTSVVKAARLHDMGKIFMPSSILNKPDDLTGDERQVMAAHAELSYQLLSVLKFDKKTLNLIRNHHNFDATSPIEQQIVSAADIYSALIEKRPYKQPMSSKQALSIMEHSNSFSKEVIDALKKINA